MSFVKRPDSGLAFAGLPARDQSILAEMGPRWSQDINANRQKVVDIYTPVLAAASRTGIRVAADIAYGEHARHRLDIYQPASAIDAGAGSAANLPVVVFVHGGAFLRGNMNSNAEIYGNVPRYFARHGFVAVNLEYRLAPEAAYPGGAQDVAAAVAWIRQHIAAYGGNPQHIVLAGHSAGGAHAASYALDPAVRGEAGAGSANIAGLILISARLRADVLPGNPNAAGVRAYWGDDSSRYELVSPVTYAARIGMPAMVVVAEFENPYLDAYGAEFFYRIVEASNAPGAIRHRHRFMQVLKHNHTSIVAHLDTEDQSLGPALIDFIASTGPLAPS
ncbi:alpha/beta hydrolase [Undibacterium sp.]|jgi:acetyl esterase|uniref:alpha/beta hydrolase n=1 Tax=Undibacterium sp. TaxID=1914977 RepID=UPI002BA870BC|nr:alpha/beta hydrolase [Undibacterium sp.]HTD05051.1 alpha/beta hydrolase [Undibacterium sp.]